MLIDTGFSIKSFNLKLKDTNALNVTQMPKVASTVENYTKLGNQLKNNFYQNVAMQVARVSIGWMKGIYSNKLIGLLVWFKSK